MSNWLEERKRQIIEERNRYELDAKGGIEERYYKSQKDAQKNYDAVKAELEKMKDEFDTYYTPAGIEKLVQNELESQARKIRNKYEQEAKSVKNKIEMTERTLKNIINMAEKDGFTIKRSEVNNDLEYRAKDQDWYQKKYNSVASDIKKLEKRWYDIQDEIKEFQKKIEKLQEESNVVGKLRNKSISDLGRIAWSAMDDGFDLKTEHFSEWNIRSEVTEDLEYRAADYRSVYDELCDLAEEIEELYTDTTQLRVQGTKNRSEAGNLLNKMKPLLKKLSGTEYENKAKSCYNNAEDTYASIVKQF